VRAQRIADREHTVYEESLQKIIDREASEKKRYKKYYKKDIDDLSLYDLVLNTRLWDQEGVFNIVKTAIEVREW
jgi:cytidylate kinase